MGLEPVNVLFVLQLTKTLTKLSFAVLFALMPFKSRLSSRFSLTSIFISSGISLPNMWSVLTLLVSQVKKDNNSPFQVLSCSNSWTWRSRRLSISPAFWRPRENRWKRCDKDKVDGAEVLLTPSIYRVSWPVRWRFARDWRLASLSPSFCCQRHQAYARGDRQWQRREPLPVEPVWLDHWSFRLV